MRPRRKRYNLADSSSEHQPPAPPGAVLRAAALARAKKTVPTVKLHAASPAFYNTFTAYGADYVEINQVRHGSSVLVMPEGPVLSWPVLRFADLAAEHFAAVLAQGPEVVVLGTGAFFLQCFKIPTGSMQPTLMGVMNNNLKVRKDLTVPSGLARVRDWFGPD